MVKVIRDTCLMFKINIYIYIYYIVKEKLKSFLRNNTALIFKFIYIYINLLKVLNFNQLIKRVFI